MVDGPDRGRDGRSAYEGSLIRLGWRVWRGLEVSGVDWPG